MDASLDTDIVIHLYKSNKRDLLFSYCDRLYMHEYLLENELKRKSYLVYEQFMTDVQKGNIDIITNSDLINMGAKVIFETYLEENNFLFDIGESYAISLAKAVGIEAFLSDDTKEHGPHDLLVRELIMDVMPFAFYELLYLRYLETDQTPEDLHSEFEKVTSSSMQKYPMNFRSRMLTTVKRFSNKYGTKRDTKWIKQFCNNRNINYKDKLSELKRLLETL
jgi:hypothetical protein